ncbi:type II secretion system F family protein, partial [Patescibacteria group bacterium]|nr:type II secretion system F family protein [Patescibacteria group bacterium]
IKNAPTPLKQKIFFTENLQVMIKSGLTLPEALNTLSLQVESRYFRKKISQIEKIIDSGRSLSSGLAKFPKTFSKFDCNLIEAGEISDSLEESLAELTACLKTDHELRSKIQSITTYPLIILVTIFGVSIGLIAFVLPKLLSLSKNLDQIKSLPLITRVLIAGNNFSQHHGLFIILILTILIAGIVYLTSSPSGQRRSHYVLLRCPIIGLLIEKINLARLTRIFSSLLRMNLPTIKALNITASAINNARYKQALNKIEKDIKKGISLAESFSSSEGKFPPLLVQLVSVGEQSKKLEELLANLADSYERQISNSLGDLAAIIELVLILILITWMGGVALAIIAPMVALT